MSNEEQPIIIKKVVKGGHGHHGGAWKVAYADFVTAMMAFFLLLWLLNVTTDEQKAGIADYFSPSTASVSSSGAGGMLGGQTLVTDGAKISDTGVPTVVMNLTPPESAAGEADDGDEETSSSETIDELSDEEIEQELAEREQESFEEAVDAIQQAIQDVPELAELSRNLIIDMTPEGMRIQLVDQDGRSMFESGKADLLDHTSSLITMITRVVERLPNKIKITGHTDATPFKADDGYGNWELSSDRANASRRALLQAGLAPARIAMVTGKAETEPLFPDDPQAASNRRISIVLLRQSRAPLPDLQ
ncbi:MAG: flagellar motor protein MotB [Minwuiales bacterium]|nr:flagellar motor protein MotB [Minwuiales bacterium]